MKRLVIFAVAGALFLLFTEVRGEVASSTTLGDIQKKMDIAVANGAFGSAARWQATLDLLSVPTPATFEEVLAIAKKGALKHVKDESEAARHANSVVIARCLYGMDKKYIAEGFNLAVADGNAVYTCLYAERYKRRLGIDNAQQFQYTLNALKACQSRPATVRAWLQRLPHLKPENVSDAAMLKELREVNQKYTSLMPADEEAWKPIVVIIRTMMDSYK